MTAVIAAFMAISLVTVVRTRRGNALNDAVFGAGGNQSVPVGTPGEVRMPLAPLGSVYAVGEEWSARSTDDRLLERGTPVRVVREEGLTLIVEPADPVGSSA